MSWHLYIYKCKKNSFVKKSRLRFFLQRDVSKYFGQLQEVLWAQKHDIISVVSVVSVSAHGHGWSQ